MNARAKKHLVKAKDYAGRGEQFYRKTAEEIIAAQEADPMLSQREIGEAMDRSPRWVRDIVQWHTNGEGHPTPYTNPSANAASDQSRAKRVLRTTPEVVAKLDPTEQRELARVLDREALKRQREREKIADEKFREKMGDETADGLELAQALTDTAWYLTKANQDLASFLKRANEIGVDAAPDRWRNRCLESIEWAEAKLSMAKALLQSDEIDWTAFEDMLGKEVN